MTRNLLAAALLGALANMPLAHAGDAHAATHADAMPTTALDGIVVVGALWALLNAASLPEQIIGFLGVLLGAGNAAGGYVVTERMLDMFKPSAKRDAGEKAP